MRASGMRRARRGAASQPRELVEARGYAVRSAVAAGASRSMRQARYAAYPSRPCFARNVADTGRGRSRHLVVKRRDVTMWVTRRRPPGTRPAILEVTRWVEVERLVGCRGSERHCARAARRADRVSDDRPKAGRCVSSTPPNPQARQQRLPCTPSRSRPAHNADRTVPAGTHGSWGSRHARGCGHGRTPPHWLAVAGFHHSEPGALAGALKGRRPDTVAVRSE